MNAQMEFSLQRGKAARDEGIALATLPRAEQLRRARLFAQRICEIKGRVTIDDVRAMMEIPAGASNGSNWIGSVFRDKRFVWTGEMVQSTLSSNHARMIKVWTLNGGQDAE